MSEMTIAEKLKKLRNRSKMSMSQVARLSEISGSGRDRITQGYISRLESGKETNPSLQKLLTLSSIYGVDPNELLIGNGKRKDSRISPPQSGHSRVRGRNGKMREVMECLAKSPKYLDAVRSLLKSDKGRMVLRHYGSISGRQKEKFLALNLKSGLKNTK